MSQLSAEFHCISEAGENLCWIGDVPEVVVEVGLSRALGGCQPPSKAVSLSRDDLPILHSQQDNWGHDGQAKERPNPRQKKP